MKDELSQGIVDFHSLVKSRVLGAPALVGLALTLVLLTTLLFVLARDHEGKLEAAGRRAAAMALGTDRLLTLEMRNLERALKGVAVDAASLSATPGQDRLRQEMVDGVAQRHAELIDLLVVDGNGRALTTGLGDPTIAQWSARADNRAHRDGLVVGAPSRLANGRDWFVPLAVRLDAGWVLARLRVSSLAGIIEGQDVGRRGVVNIFHRDGTLLARSLPGSTEIGQDFSQSELMRELPLHRNGSSDLVSPLDGVRRILSYRALRDYPLVVVVGVARAEVLAPWNLFAIAAALVCLFYVLGWSLLVRTLLRSNRRQRTLVGELRRTSENLLEAQDIAGIGSWILDIESDRVEFSRQAQWIYGWNPGDPPLTLQTCLAQTHPEDREQLERDYGRYLATGIFEDTRYRIVRPDGGVRSVIARGRLAEVEGRPSMLGTVQDITDLARVHAQLHETEAQYRLLFEQNPLPFWVFHRETFQILEANEAAVAQYGYSRKEFQAMTLADIRPPEDVEEALNAARSSAPESRRGRIWRHLRKDGEVINVAVHSSDITFRGRPARLVLAMDVTDRIAEQRRLELSESRFQMVARATSDAVFDWNIVTGETWRSASFDSLFNFRQAGMPHTIAAWWDRVHPDDLERVKLTLEELFQGSGSEWHAYYRFRRGDGSYAHVLDRGLLKRSADGKPSRMVGGMVDVTRQHQDEAELRLLRRAIESTENGISIVDALAEDMPLVYVNAAFQKITGYNEAEALGRNCRFLQADDRTQAGLQVIRDAIETHQEARVLLRNYRKDGELFYNQFSVAPVREDTGMAGHGGGDGGRVTHFVGIINDVTESHRHEGELAFQASHDELTGLLNRSALLAGLEHMLSRGEGTPVTLLYLDVNNFKMINDSLGHEVGDEVLRVIARRLRKVTGAADRAGRIGGNEFLVLVPHGADPASGQAQVDAALKALTQPIEALETLHYLSINAGIARYPDHGSEPDVLFKYASLATHEARRRGPNQIAVYTPQFERAVADRQHMVSRLHEAIERNEFELFFQPLFGTEPLRPIGLEALIRWRHPERGLVPPSEFIPVCEDSGLIVPLGRWVLREACRHHRLLAEAGWGALTIAVNVSAMQFLSGELQNDVPALLNEFKLPAGVLELELTESLVMENPESVIDVMRELRGHGVLLSIDDFGTGYSSMSYLHRLPVDKLKIDRSFVADVETDGHNAAICESILALARSFDLKVIAEGVETQAQLDWLRRHGCHEAQGYLLARPQAFAEMLLGLGDGPAQ